MICDTKMVPKVIAENLKVVCKHEEQLAYIEGNNCQKLHIRYHISSRSDYNTEH